MVLTAESSSGQYQEADILEDIEDEQETLPELSLDDFEPVEAQDSAIEFTQIAAWTKRWLVPQRVFWTRPMETIGGKHLFGLISPLLRFLFLV